MARDEEEAGRVRKVVTVVFSDLAGSTGLGERLDPESLTLVMGLYFERTRAVLERHGGTVQKFIGDAVMAVFGIPVVREDDALRAVRAAAELSTALAELNAELVRDHGVSLELRTGVNTGEVLAGDPAAAQALALGGGTVPGQHLAGVDTRAQLERHPMVPDELGVQLGQGGWQLGSGPDRPQSVVLAADRDTEHRHDRIADELLDGATMALQHRPGPLEVPAHHQRQRLRIQPLPEPSRAGQITEHNRDHLPDPPSLLLITRHRGAATRAKSGGVRAPDPTDHTCTHLRIVTAAAPRVERLATWAADWLPA